MTFRNPLDSSEKNNRVYLYKYAQVRKRQNRITERQGDNATMKQQQEINKLSGAALTADTIYGPGMGKREETKNPF